MAVCMKFRFIPANTGEQNGCSSGTRSDKQIERKILHVYMDLFSFFYPSSFSSSSSSSSFRVLLCLKVLVVIGFTALVFELLYLGMFISFESV